MSESLESKNWSQRLRINGKQIELGLGSYPTVPLTEARSLAAKNKALSAQGINPKTHKEKPTIIPTFAEIADTVLEIKNAELTNEKHKAQWRSTLEQYAYPTIGSLPVNQITVDHIHSLLELYGSRRQKQPVVYEAVSKLFSTMQ